MLCAVQCGSRVSYQPCIHEHPGPHHWKIYPITQSFAALILEPCPGVVGVKSASVLRQDLMLEPCTAFNPAPCALPQVQELAELPDPCPLPSSVKRRGLNDKDRLIYAPMADVGGLLYDKDAMYIDIPDWKVRSGSYTSVGDKP